jgi:hypothetical protein
MALNVITIMKFMVLLFALSGFGFLLRWIFLARQQPPSWRRINSTPQMDIIFFRFQRLFAAALICVAAVEGDPTQRFFSAVGALIWLFASNKRVRDGQSNVVPEARTADQNSRSSG